MPRAAFFLTLGILSSALLIAVISVYVFHDVDRGMDGRLGEAFIGLCMEAIPFALIIGAPAGLLAMIGRQFFRLKGYSPGAWRSFLLGIGIPVLQYPWDLSARWMFPNAAELFLYIYLAVAIVVCTTALILDSLRQKRLFEALKPAGRCGTT